MPGNQAEIPFQSGLSDSTGSILFHSEKIPVIPDYPSTVRRFSLPGWELPPRPAVSPSAVSFTNSADDIRSVYRGGRSVTIIFFITAKPRF